MKNRIKQKLEKFNINYTEKANSLEVYADKKVTVTVDFSEVGVYSFKESLKGWNFLTGVIEMSIKSAMVYNLVGAFIVSLLLWYDGVFPNYMILFFFLFIINMVSWTTYYLIKAENTKRMLRDWIDNF
jgi:hypothetical protein